MLSIYFIGYCHVCLPTCLRVQMHTCHFSAHYCLVHFLLERGPVPASTCKGWFMFLAVSCSLLQMNLVAILVLRGEFPNLTFRPQSTSLTLPLVWALYREDRKVVFAVCTLVVLPFVVSFVLIGRNVVAGDNFNQQCDLHHTPIEAPVLACVYSRFFSKFSLTPYLQRGISDVAYGALVPDLQEEKLCCAERQTSFG